jgi:F-type H+-transporting ATPase subunit alpha
MQFLFKMQLNQVGRISAIKDDLITVKGLPFAQMGSVLITKSNTKLLVTAIHKNQLNAVAFQSPIQLLDKLNDNVYGFNNAITISAHFNYFNCIIDPLGNTLLKLTKGLNKENVSNGRSFKGFVTPASIATRMSVCEPVLTGVKAIDLVIPIGRGQRELVIGDRKTGKTQITVDSILNQRRSNKLLSLDGQNFKNLICIYVGIGQRASSIKQLALKLARKNAL